MANKAFQVTVRRIATGCDYHIRIFSKSAEMATERAIDNARFIIGMSPAKYRLLTGAKGVAVFRVVSCEVSADQSRPVV